MLSELLFALWFFLPAGMANMIPVPIAKIPGLRKFNTPLDFGKTWRGVRVLGAHKTWRGLIAGIVVGILTVWLQQYLVHEYGWFASQAAVTDYTALPILWLGLAFALGALGGDAAKSFFKRRQNLGPGAVWLPWDLIDHIIGAAVFALPFVIFAWWIYPAVIIIWLFANLFVSYIGYWIGIKESPL